MPHATARFRSRIPVPRPFVWEHYTRPGMFERLGPPWQHIKVLAVEGDVRPGDRLVLRPRLGPLPLIWEALHEEYIEGELFSDRQGWGPFAHWLHRHHFRDDGAGGCIVDDELQFALPLSGVSHPPGLPIAARELRRMFYYRHFVAYFDLLEHYALRARPRRAVAVRGDPAPVRDQLAAYLSVAGHSVTRDDEAALADTVEIALEAGDGGALVARIRGPSDATELQVTTGMLLDRSLTTRLRVARLLPGSADRPLAWTTVSDVAHAIHRCVLGLYDGSQLQVAHSRPTTARDLARHLGSGMGRLAALLPDSDDAPTQAATEGGDVTYVRASRYRDAAHALRVMDGRP